MHPRQAMRESTGVGSRGPGSWRSSTVAKVAYGGVFVVLLPLLLWAWAVATAPVVGLAAPHAPRLGASLVTLGIGLVLAGAWALRVHGGGLPMNAFPPPRFVRRGVYALLPHPMYVGFCAAVLGTSLASGSASGLWLVTPLTIAGCVALVLGYERHDLLRRFGVAHPDTWLHLAPDEPGPATRSDRASVALLVLAPWLALFTLVARLPPPRDARLAFLPGELGWPTLPGAELLAGSTFAAVALAVVAAPTRAQVRRFALRGLLAMAFVFPLHLVVPLVAPARGDASAALVPRAVEAWSALDGPAAAVPSFHALWTALAAAALAAAWPRARVAAWAWGALAVAGNVASGRAPLVGAVTGVLAAVVVARAGVLWAWLRDGAERVANSWHEWRLGPVRLLNHAIYAALGTLVGVALAGWVLGPGSAGAVVLTALCTVVFAGAWAQVIEGSPQLLRPFGYYGGVVGVVVGSLLAPLVGVPAWAMLAASALAGPWVQGIGRLRCLVQGCCHGSPAPPAVGIRYTHPQSRVFRLAHLEGVPLHPTPLYSTLWNVFIALVLSRAWSLQAPLHLLCGLYLLLTGLGRFVEEAYRGEPQTKVWAGLRLYQWIAAGTALAGVAVSALGRSGPAMVPEWSWGTVPVALALAALSYASMGVDFPASSRRFSRLV